MHRRVIRLLVSVSALSLFACSDLAQAQSTDSLPNIDKQIVLGSEVTLGDKTGDGWVSATGNVVRTSEHYLVNVFPAKSVIHLYSRDGKFLRILGGEGSGPGEYRYIRALRTSAGDSIHVFDVMLGRRTVLSPDLTPVRSTRIPVNMHPRGGIVLRDGSVVVNADVYTPDGIGFPLHLIGARGESNRSFGLTSDIIVDSQHNTQTGMRRVCLSESADEVWTSYYENPLFERWNVRSGRRTDSFFYAPAEGETIADIACDDSDNLWVISRVEQGGLEPDGERPMYDRADTIVRVFRSKTHQIVAQTKLDYFPLGLIGAEALVLFDDQDEEWHKIIVIEVALSSSQQGGAVNER